MRLNRSQVLSTQYGLCRHGNIFKATLGFFGGTAVNHTGLESRYCFSSCQMLLGIMAEALYAVNERPPHIYLCCVCRDSWEGVVFMSRVSKRGKEQWAKIVIYVTTVTTYQMLDMKQSGNLLRLLKLP